MPIETIHVLQADQGSTGSTTATSVTVSLPNPVTVGNVVLVALGQAGQVAMNPPTPAGNQWIGDVESAAAFGVANCGYFHLFSQAADVTDHSWVWTFTSNAVAWAAVEISHNGLMLNDGAIGTVPEGNVFASAGVGTSGTTIDTTQGIAADYPDPIVLAGFVGRVTSGAPPAFSSVADTNNTPETIDWTQLGATVATSRAADPNVRLDLYYKGLQGAGPPDATGTYASAVLGRVAVVCGYRSVQVPVLTAMFGQVQVG